VIAEADDAELSYALVDCATIQHEPRAIHSGLGWSRAGTGFEFDENDRPHCGNRGGCFARITPDLPAFKERNYFDGPADPQERCWSFEIDKDGYSDNRALRRSREHRGQLLLHIGNGNEKVYTSIGGIHASSARYENRRNMRLFCGPCGGG
jgi:hypothetical protein